MILSFIIIAYNEEHTIAPTLTHILAQQGLPTSYEVIVVNDGSKDQTLDVVTNMAASHPAIKIVNQPNQGRGAARAAGVSVATGQYFAFVDADTILPPDWFSRCLPYMQNYDACGGTAVPDGDVAYIHRVLQLVPKAAPHTTTVTGNNGLFKREVFDVVSFNPTKKNGEDVDLGHQIIGAGLKSITIPGLLVEHNELKSYAGSLGWLFVSGRGASRQFYEHKEIRVPDLAFFGFVGIVLLAILGLAFTSIAPIWPLLIVLGFITASSLMHLHGKFELTRTPCKSLIALLVNDTLLLAYYLGRCLGMAIEWKRP